ncbi:sulfur carrier protein [Lentibacillus persicus]|uniref:Sulfur carrier protein n=1 Tax=Lentibacillus persicus TaxID=640948 RepID=A0A1I1YZF4_9BACI|nr:sulfur carrier protein ThiS [Lentibacillus persicus]SFE24358.1 sulfur carrier protein [Lentibacillus persicus]
MSLYINGSTIDLPAHVTTVSDVILHFFDDPPVVIVEHNGDIIDKTSHSTREVADGDKLEFVHFVGGG